MAVSQIGWSMLFMWLLEGRSEAQFHVFVSLAFLAFYRDWRVLLTATLAAIAYPIVRIVMLPDSYVVGASAWWRVFDQGIWVVGEFCMLLLAVRAQPEDRAEILGACRDARAHQRSDRQDMSKSAPTSSRAAANSTA